MGTTKSRLDLEPASETSGGTIATPESSLPSSVKTLNSHDRAIMEALTLSPVSSPRSYPADSVSDDRVEPVRSVPGASKVLSQTQARKKHVGKSGLKRGPGSSEEFYSSSDSEESSSEFDPDKMAAEVESGFDPSIGVVVTPEVTEEVRTPTIDDELGMILHSPDQPVSQMPDMNRKRSALKTVAYLDETAHSAVVKRRSQIGVDDLKEDEPRTKEALMRRYMAEIHITIIGPVFGTAESSAVPLLGDLSPRSLKLTMATMAEAPDEDGESMFAYEPLLVSDTIRGMSPLEMKSVRGAIWTNVYCWTQLMCLDKTAPWMRKSTKVRSGLKHLDIVVSEKVYSHEYDSHDKDLVFIDETMVFPILPFKSLGKLKDKSTSSKVKSMTAGTEGLSHIHPQIAYGCFQNLTADTPGCMMFRLKQVIQNDGFACMSGSQSSVSVTGGAASSEQLRTESSVTSQPLLIGGDGSTSPTATMNTTVKDLACSMLYVQDLFANISKVVRSEISSDEVAQRERMMSDSLITRDSSGESKSSLLSRTKKSYRVLYESDSFLYQLPLYKSLDKEIVRVTSAEIDRLGITTPDELIAKSKIDEKRYSNLSYRALKKPKASGALICQCQFVWKAD